MPAYIGNKKVKELYYGGKKVKEAWYGGKKVYGGFTTWKSGVMYVAGDVVQVDGVSYLCEYDHQSREEYRPKTGKWWTNIWKVA